LKGNEWQEACPDFFFCKLVTEESILKYSAFKDKKKSNLWPNDTTDNKSNHKEIFAQKFIKAHFS